jgi:hypothetical protein
MGTASMSNPIDVIRETNVHGEDNGQIMERKLVLYGIRLSGVYLSVDGAYRLARPVLDTICASIGGRFLPEQWTWFWVLREYVRPIVETAAGSYLIWGGAWLACLIVRSVASAAEKHPTQKPGK